MNQNNQMYRLYKEMIQGFKDNNQVIFEHGAFCWTQIAPENPFQVDTKEYEYFFQMKRCYEIWERGDVNRKINRRKLIEWAGKLCELYPKNPYKFDKKADEEDKAQKAAEEEARAKAAEEASAKQIEAEAERIVKEEHAKKQNKMMKEKARIEYEKAKAFEKEKEERRKEALQKAVEEKRAHILGVIPDESDNIRKVSKDNIKPDEDLIMEEKLEKSESFLSRLKHKFQR